VEVYTSLAGDTTATVTVECVTTNRNPFIDTVEVTAKSSSSLTDPDLSDDHTTGSGETCSFTGVAAATATKCCVSVTIDPDSLVPHVCVKITVNNTSTPAEALKDVVVIDDKLGTVTPAAKDTIASGASKTYSGCYDPTTSDTTGDPVDPGTITFTDNVTTVSGTGAVSGTTFSLTGVALPSAVCNLCGPQDQPCPANP
jgi:hypothetical protein